MEEISKKIVVTIGRQFGSGGRVIGKKIAEQLGIAFYDKELIERAANESGIDKSFSKIWMRKDKPRLLFSCQ